MGKNKREDIESKILASSRSIGNILDIESWEWLSSPQIGQFIDHFRELRIYYRDTGDPTISRDVLLEYTVWIRFFKMLVDAPFEPSTGEEIPQDAKLKAQHHVDGLQSMLDMIVEYEGW